MTSAYNAKTNNKKLSCDCSSQVAPDDSLNHDDDDDEHRLHCAAFKLLNKLNWNYPFEPWGWSSYQARPSIRVHCKPRTTSPPYCCTSLSPSFGPAGSKRCLPPSTGDNPALKQPQKQNKNIRIRMENFSRHTVIFEVA